MTTTARVRLVLGTASLLAYGAPTVTAQPPRPSGPVTAPYVRRMLDLRDGLPEAQVNAIARSADGYLWLGTRRGLVRYDGLTFTLFEPGTTPGLPAAWINDVRIDQRQRLWLSTAAGLAVRDSAGVLRRVDTAQVPAIDVWSTYEDRRGVIWVATERGVFRGDGQRFVAVQGATGFTYALAEDARGRMWMAGRGVLAYVDGSGVTDVSATLGLRARNFSILADGPDRMWVGSARGATEIGFTPEGTPRVVREVSTQLGLSMRPVWAVARAQDGSLWLGTETSGTLRFDGTRIKEMSDVPLETWAFHLDADGTVWAGTGSGLERYQKSAFTTLRDGLPANPVWAARLDSRGGIWAALSDGSVYRSSGGRFSMVTAPGTEELSAPFAAADDGMFVAERGRSLLHVFSDGRRQPIPMLAPPIGVMLGMLGDRGALWISADSGLFQLRDGRLRPMNHLVGLPPGARPREMVVDSAGRLYLGRPWLTVVEGNTPRTFGAADGLSSPSVRAILPRGAFTWVGTSDSGLFVLHRDTIRSLGKIDVRLRREILGLAADNDGHLWVSWGYGLMRVSLPDLEAAVLGRQTRVRIRSFDQSDGLPAGSFRGDFQSRLAMDSVGLLYAPNAVGVVRIDPRAIAPDTAPPSVVIEAMLVNGKPMIGAHPQRLPTGVGRVEFVIATPGALRPTEVRLQYRLVGVDSSWLDAGTRRAVSFGPLSGGRYRFEARAATEEGDWTRQPDAVAFDVAFRLHEHRLFVPFLLLGTGGVVVLATRARRLALERRGRQLTRDVAERTSELEAARASLEQRVAERTAQLAGELAERERLQHALIEAQKLDGLGRLAGGVAHEINNGMASVLGFTELAALKARTHTDLLSDLDQVRRAGDRVTAIVRQLLQFARRQHVERVPVDLGQLVRELRRSLEELLGARVALTIHAADALPPVNADAAQMEQVLVNLIMNARDAMPEGGRVTIELQHRVLAKPDSLSGVELAEGAYIWLRVRDTGRGIAPDVRARLFEPFFTTKGLAEGTGLGLAVSHGIVLEHGGAITVESAPGQGAAFDIWLPVALAPALAAARSEDNSAVAPSFAAADHSAIP